MLTDRHNLGKIFVLIVDDTPVNRILVKNALDFCTVLEAAESTSALDILRSRDDIDVILLDIMLPGMSGYELCQLIKTQPRWRMIPVIMLTALNSVESRVNALQSGADDFISKPYELIELQARVLSSARAKRYNERLEDTEKILFTIANIVENKDTVTNGHLQRIELLAQRFCHRLGLNTQEIEVVRYGGLLHDIGKIGIDDAILKKPGKLTPEEYKIMQQHSLIGFNLVSPLRMGSQVAPVVRAHHERWDGLGYPDGLAGEDIPHAARIIHIVDVFDALTSERPYRQPISSDEALQYIKENSGTHFDPHLVPVFAQMIQDYH